MDSQHLARLKLGIVASSTRSMMQHSINYRLALVLFSLKLIVQVAQASISIQNVDIDLVRLQPATKTEPTSSPAVSSSAMQPIYALTNVTSANPASHHRPDPVIASETANTAPIYQSAPKQIDSLAIDKPSDGGSSGGGGHQVNLDQLIGRRNQQEVAGDDLSTAAGHHKKKKHHHHKKKKIIVVKKKKKKKKKKKRKKKKKIIVVKKKHHHKKKKHGHKKKKKVVYYKPKHSHRIEHHYQPKKYTQESVAQHHHHHHGPAAVGKYYEYRSVPKKGAWEFGFKRGNMKHHIERKEHGHKSHFKTIFNWKDKKGNGKHLFDYNHDEHHKGGGHHKHAYGAAASQGVPKKVEAVVLLSKEKSA